MRRSSWSGAGLQLKAARDNIVLDLSRSTKRLTVILDNKSLDFTTPELVRKSDQSQRIELRTVNPKTKAIEPVMHGSYPRNDTC